MTGDWTARLGGDDRSLQELASRFTQGRHRVKHENEGYHLTSPDLTACRTDGEAWTVAERIVSHINRGAQVDNRRFRPVHVAAINYLEPDGKRHHYLRAGLGAYVVLGEQATLVITRADGTVEVEGTSAQPLAERLVGLQESEGPGGPVSRALEQWELPEQTPTSLNNILEIIAEDVSGGKRAWGTMARAMAPLVGMSAQQLDDELRRCRDSLHDPSAVGPLARHGSSRPVTNPMNLDEVGDFVRRILLAWLQGKI